MNQNWVKLLIELGKIAVIIVGFIVVRTMFNNDDAIIKIEERQKEILQTTDSLIKIDAINKESARIKDSVLIQKIDGVYIEMDKLERQSRQLDSKINSFEKVRKENQVDLPNPWEE